MRTWNSAAYKSKDFENIEEEITIFLEENKLEYTEVDIEKDDEGRKEMVEKTGNLNIPVIEIDGKIFLGFNKSLLQRVLGVNN